MPICPYRFTITFCVIFALLLLFTTFAIYLQFQRLVLGLFFCKYLTYIIRKFAQVTHWRKSTHSPRLTQRSQWQTAMMTWMGAVMRSGNTLDEYDWSAHVWRRPTRTQTDPQMFDEDGHTHTMTTTHTHTMTLRRSEHRLTRACLSSIWERRIGQNWVWTSVIAGGSRRLSLETNMSHSPSTTANKIRLSLRQKAEELRRERSDRTLIICTEETRPLFVFIVWYSLLFMFIYIFLYVIFWPLFVWKLWKFLVCFDACFFCFAIFICSKFKV